MQVKELKGTTYLIKIGVFKLGAKAYKGTPCDAPV